MRHYPIVVASTDGLLALKVTELIDIGGVPNRDAIGYRFRVLHGPGDEDSRLTVMFSGITYSLNEEYLSVPTYAQREATFEAAALAAIGDYLDEAGLPPLAESGKAAPYIECFSSRFMEWKQRPAAEDEVVESYIRSHLYWSWKHRVDRWQVSYSDAIRLALDLEGIDRLIKLGEGHEWKVDERNPTTILLIPTMDLINAERAARRPHTLCRSAERSSSRREHEMASVFLSHNSQDKFFVRELAERLREAGARVWLDEAEIKIGDSLTAKIGQAIDEPAR